MAYLTRADGKVYKITPKHSGVFSSSELIPLVGTDFEIITLLSDDLLLIEKDQGDWNKPLNELATKLAHEKVRGTAIILSPTEID